LQKINHKQGGKQNIAYIKKKQSNNYWENEQDMYTHLTEKEV
jgi:hypothetical protein